MERDFNVWRDLYRAYLTRLGTYKTGTTTRMDSEQHPRVTVRDSGFVSTLRQAYILLGRGLRSSSGTREGHLGSETDGSIYQSIPVKRAA